MSLFTLIVILAYLVAIGDGTIRLGRFLKGVERDARKCFKNKRDDHRGPAE